MPGEKICWALLKSLLVIIVVVMSFTSESICVPGEMRAAPVTANGPRLPVLLSSNEKLVELFPASSESTRDANNCPLARFDRSTCIVVAKEMTILPVLTISEVLGSASSMTIL